MLEQHLEAPRPGRSSGLNVEASANLALALNQAFLGATIGTPYAAALRVVDHPDAVRARDGVARYRVVKRPLRTTVLDFVMGGGLCVGSSRRGTWMVHSPSVQQLDGELHDHMPNSPAAQIHGRPRNGANT